MDRYWVSPEIEEYLAQRPVSVSLTAEEIADFTQHYRMIRCTTAHAVRTWNEKNPALAISEQAGGKYVRQPKRPVGRPRNPPPQPVEERRSIMGFFSRAPKREREEPTQVEETEQEEVEVVAPEAQ